LGCGLNGRGSIPGRGSDVIPSLRPRVRTGSGAHSAFCPLGIGSKVAEAWGWPSTFI